MELKKMLQLCKKNKCIEVLYFGSDKFLSCGCAFMNISGIAPDWNVEDCAIALELCEEDLKNYKTSESSENKNIYKDDLINIERSTYSLNVDGITLQPFRLPDGCMIYADMTLLAVFRSERNKTYAFIDQYGICGVGIFVDSIFCGYVAVNKIDNNSICRFAKSLSVGAELSARKGFFNAGGQVSIEDVEQRMKYMDNEQQRWRNTVNNAQGYLFENQIKKGCNYYSINSMAEIDKTPEPFRVLNKSKNGIFTGRFTANAQPDFKGVLKGGKAIVFESKYTTTDKLHQNVITNEQFDALERYSRLGAVVGVCAGIKDKCYFIPWVVFRDMKKIFGRNYVTQQDIKCYEVESNGAVLFLSYM